MGFFKKIFGDYSEKEVKRVMPLVEKINGFENEISKLTDADLRAKTADFKVRVQDRRNFRRVIARSFCSC